MEIKSNSAVCVYDKNIPITASRFGSTSSSLKLCLLRDDISKTFGLAVAFVADAFLAN